LQRISDIVGTKKRKATAALIVALMLVGIPTALAQLNVKINVTGTVVGQTKEMTISAQGSVDLLGTTTILPACAIAAASSFADTSVATLAFGTGLQANTDYETFFCVGNIGASAGIIHVAVSSTDGATYTVEQCNSGLTGLTFSILDGATIGAGGVVAVRVHVHTPAVGLNAQTTLNGVVSFTFS
jgi:hypothetical protein